MARSPAIRAMALCLLVAPSVVLAQGATPVTAHNFVRAESA